MEAQSFLIAKGRLEGRISELVGAVTHVTGDERYRWLTDRLCVLAGEVRPREDGRGANVVFEVSELVWERPR